MNADDQERHVLTVALGGQGMHLRVEDFHAHADCGGLAFEIVVEFCDNYKKVSNRCPPFGNKINTHFGWYP